MKTLYDRLKPEFRVKLDEEAIRFPTSIGRLIHILKENVSANQITFGDAITLHNFVYTLTPFSVLSYYEIFEYI